MLRIERLRSGVPPLAGETKPTILAEVPYAINTGTYYTFRAVANGGVLKFFVNGVEQLSAYDSVFQRGGFGMNVSGAEVRFDDAKVEMLP